MMKQFNVLLLSLSLLVSVGCSTAVVDRVTNPVITPSAPVTLSYTLTQCNTVPWETYQQLHAGLTTEQSIQGYYQDTYQITLLSVVSHSAPAGFFTCQACGCATGESITITVSADQAPQLLELGFTDQATNPVSANISATNTIANTNLVDINTVDDNATATTTTENAAADTADQALRDRALTVQSALATYNNKHKAYPDSIDQLKLTIDLTGITYTPIGSTPANYYDLTVGYSTGVIVLNP